MSLRDRDRLILAALRDRVDPQTIARGLGRDPKTIYARIAKLKADAGPRWSEAIAPHPPRLCPHA